MRFFCAACLIGIVVASLGCMTKNWSSSLFRDSAAKDADIDDSFPIWRPRRARDKLFQPGTGLDPEAKEIERHLGFK